MCRVIQSLDKAQCVAIGRMQATQSLSINFTAPCQHRPAMPETSGRPATCGAVLGAPAASCASPSSAPLSVALSRALRCLRAACVACASRLATWTCPLTLRPVTCTHTQDSTRCVCYDGLFGPVRCGIQNSTGSVCCDRTCGLSRCLVHAPIAGAWQGRPAWTRQR